MGSVDSQPYYTRVQAGRVVRVKLVPAVRRAGPTPASEQPTCRRCWHLDTSHMLLRSLAMLSVLCVECWGWPACAWRLDRVEAA